MRVFPACACALVILATPAFALDIGDTMQAWAGASPTDKDALLRRMDAVDGTRASRADVRSCLDDTSKAAGHANLPISDVAKACSERAARENI